MPISASALKTSSGSDTLTYKQAIEAIIRLDADLCTCEEKLKLEKQKSAIYKKQSEDCFKAADLNKKKVFWGKVKDGAKKLGIGAVIGFVIGVFVK